MAEISVSAADLAHGDVVPQLLTRCDALFGAIIGPRNLSPAMDRLAAEIGAVGLDAAELPLTVALRDADRLAAYCALAAPGQGPGASVVAAGLAGTRLLRRYRRLSRRGQGRAWRRRRATQPSRPSPPSIRA